MSELCSELYVGRHIMQADAMQLGILSLGSRLAENPPIGSPLESIVMATMANGHHFFFASDSVTITAHLTFHVLPLFLPEDLLPIAKMLPPLRRPRQNTLLRCGHQITAVSRETFLASHHCE